MLKPTQSDEEWFYQTRWMWTDNGKERARERARSERKKYIRAHTICDLIMCIVCDEFIVLDKYTKDDGLFFSILLRQFVDEEIKVVNWMSKASWDRQTDLHKATDIFDVEIVARYSLVF